MLQFFNQQFNLIARQSFFFEKSFTRYIQRNKILNNSFKIVWKEIVKTTGCKQQIPINLISACLRKQVLKIKNLIVFYTSITNGNVSESKWLWQKIVTLERYNCFKVLLCQIIIKTAIFQKSFAFALVCYHHVSLNQNTSSGECLFFKAN